ncbi:hypothetical protein D9757_005531 [Collybiopsis confluens]|uniref:Uncharacterized protein n=1 Tax=Collybiopsis confluens TaxID=2823264 RepID=A0A8H5HLX9_9AGAR|nr:hypothetical protein D9757_005531 [Collybiopsis confluens]
MGLENLCDEVLQLVFCSLHDPTPFTLVSKRLHAFSQDPYVRAQYFLNRYGRAQAVYEALGRGKVLNEKVLNILISSGAHVSRYLIQIAMHHYFHTQSHPFVKTKWVRNIKFEVFVHFMQLGAEMYGEIPREKGQDDGSLFNSFVRERSYPVSMRSTTWETIRDILEKHNFFPFSSKDPLLAQFPLALAIEPRLLPYAVANGFYMDEKYRDFVFRKMFENSTLPDRTTEAIVKNVRELCRLDPQMFLSRTVAGEICMEAQNNEAGYSALKTLANASHPLSPHLVFAGVPGALSRTEFPKPTFTLYQLASSHLLTRSVLRRTLVQDLIKLFLKSRSITLPNTQANLQRLFADFSISGSDPSVRLVMILTAFLPACSGGAAGSASSSSVSSLKERLDALKLKPPVSLDDMMNLFLHPLMERYTPVFEYLKKEVRMDTSESDDDKVSSKRKGMKRAELKSIVEKVAVRLLETDCKGKLLKILHDTHDLHESVREVVIRTVLDKYGEEVKLGNLPDVSTSKIGAPRETFKASLCKEKEFYSKPLDEAYFWTKPSTSQEPTPTQDSTSAGGDAAEEQPEVEMTESDGSEGKSAESEPLLGVLGQNSLTTMINQEDVFPARTRRRTYTPAFILNHDHFSYFPTDTVSVAKWIKNEFGPTNKVTSIFMTHAILNDSTTVLRSYLHDPSGTPVPITLKHFELLARVGQNASYTIFAAIQGGAEFYRGEDAYVNDSVDSPSPKWKAGGYRPRKNSVGISHSQAEVVIERSAVAATDLPRAAVSPSASSGGGRKRPRRSAAAAAANRSYVEPDSDDEDMEADDAMVVDLPEEKAAVRKTDHLQLWVKHLGELQKSEQSKFRARKKQAAAEDPSVVVEKTEFLKSLSSNLRMLRKYAEEKRKTDEPQSGTASDYDDDDPEYVYKSPRSKKRKAQPRKD